MEFVGFDKADFELFEVPGLDARMHALRIQLRPKLEQLGEDLAPIMSDLCDKPMYGHVAKHARRKVNPPMNSWVAISSDKRGYKKHPHFEIGAWHSHVFAIFGLLSESPMRALFADRLKKNAGEILRIFPENYIWIPDHTYPEGILARDISVLKLEELAAQMTTTRQGELLFGMQFPKRDVIHLSAAEFEYAVIDCFTTMIPLFRLAQSEVIA